MSKKRKSKSRFGANIARDTQRQKDKRKGYGYLVLPDGVKQFKEKANKDRTYVDIIPYIVSDKKHLDMNPDDPESAHVGNPWYKRPIQVHHSIGAKTESVVCPRSVGKKCPICEYREAELKDGVEWKEVVGKTSDRNLYVVIPKKNKEYDEEMHIWDISQFCFQEKLNEEMDEDSDNQIFPDPEDGKTLKIRFSEETFGGKGKNKYPKASRIDFEDRKKGYKESIMKDSPDLDTVFTVLSYKDLEAKFLEQEDDDTGEGDDDVKTSKKKKDRKKKSAGKKGKEKEKKITRGGSKNKKGKKDECPEGYKFGKDFDEYDDCDDCSLREQCGDVNEKY